MTYENKERRIESANKKKELELNLIKEYISSNSFEEFVMNCSIKYGYAANNCFNKYWIYYHMNDFGVAAFIACYSLAPALAFMPLLIVALIFRIKLLIAISIMSLVLIPLGLVTYLDCLYDDMTDNIEHVIKHFTAEECHKTLHFPNSFSSQYIFSC